MKAIVLCTAAALTMGGLASISSAAILDPGLSGNTTFSQWDFTTLDNSSGDYGTFNPGVPDGLTFGWSTAGNVAGSDQTPLFNKITGTNGVIYLNTLYVGPYSTGQFSITMTPANPQVNTVVFQLLTGDGSNETNLLNDALPTLNYTQGQNTSQAVLADSQSTIIGQLPAAGHNEDVNETLWTLQWDLSSVGPVDSYEIDWGMVIHSQMVGARLDQSTVPEPATLALVSLGGLVLLRRRNGEGSHGRR